LSERGGFAQVPLLSPLLAVLLVTIPSANQRATLFYCSFVIVYQFLCATFKLSTLALLALWRVATFADY
jgi:hypothetical protein